MTIKRMKNIHWRLQNLQSHQTFWIKRKVSLKDFRSNCRNLLCQIRTKQDPHTLNLMLQSISKFQKILRICFVLWIPTLVLPASVEIDNSGDFLSLRSQLSTIMDAFTLTSGKLSLNSPSGIFLNVAVILKVKYIFYFYL